MFVHRDFPVRKNMSILDVLAMFYLRREVRIHSQLRRLKRDILNRSIGPIIPAGRIRPEMHLPSYPGGLNGSTQHFLEVYSQESENLKSLAGVDLTAAPLGSDPTGNSRTGQFSSGSIVVRARLCFRSSRVARDSADHRSKLSHPWPP